jgi:branched-chain amino acid transport system ATP-binding protein
VTLLALADVHTYYGEAHVLQGVSLRVAAGEVVTLIGRNGAGKTTTLRSVMGLVPARRGRIVFEGVELTRLPTHEVARRGIAYVPEERRVLPNLTVLENLRLGMLGSGPGTRAGGVGASSDNNALIEEVLTYFPPLRARLTQKGKSLSGGEQQMLAIARGLVARPTLMLVDEPTEGLAPLLIQNLTEILREINRRGTTILLVEQNLEVALALSHRLYVMDQGRIQFEGTPDALRKDPVIQQRFLGI